VFRVSGKLKKAELDAAQCECESIHSRIGYVTPVQKHTGQAEQILKQRTNQLTAVRNTRIECWRSQPLTEGGL